MSLSFRDTEGSGYELQAVLQDNQDVYVVIGKGSEFSLESRFYRSFNENPSIGDYLAYFDTFFRTTRQRKTNVYALQPFGFPWQSDGPFRHGPNEKESAALLQSCRDGKPPVYYWRPYTESPIKDKLHALSEPHPWANALFVYDHGTGNLRTEPLTDSTS